MSAENVEIVTALQPDPDVDLVELFGDERGWDNLGEAIGAIFHPDVEVRFVGGGETTSNYGTDGFRRAWVDWLAPWETYRAEIQEMLDYGDSVLVITDDYGRKKGMTAEVRLLGGAVWTFREGRIASIHFYLDRQQAFDDLRASAAILGDE